MSAGNALAEVRFTLDIPEEKVSAILRERGITIDAYEDQASYEAACLAVQDWADEAWPHKLDWITSTPEVTVEDIA